MVCVACKGPLFGQGTGPRFSFDSEGLLFGQGIGPHLSLVGGTDDGCLIMMSPMLQRDFRFGSGPPFRSRDGPHFPFGVCSANVFCHMSVFCMLVAHTYVTVWNLIGGGFTYGFSDLVMVCS